MKKNLFIALLCMVSVVLFSACNAKGLFGGGTDPEEIDVSKLDNTIEKCWEVTYSLGGQSDTQYAWGTEYMVVYTLQQQQKMVGGLGKWSYKESSAADEQSCLAKNPEWEPSQCWKITVNMAGQAMNFYLWSDTEGVLASIESYKRAGYTCSYEKADAKDQNACEKLNEDNPGPGPDPDPDPDPDPKDYSQYDDTTPKCWEVTASAFSMTTTEFVWLTERQLVMSLDAAGSNYSYKPAAANDHDACEALNGSDPDPDPDPDPQGEKGCWLLSYTVAGQTISAYAWLTEAEAKEAVAAVNGTYEKNTASTADACEALNDDNPLLQGDPFCWALTVNFMGQSQTFYLWGTEETIKIAVAAAEEQYAAVGATISYQKASADDENACNALNSEN